jgi:cytochrome c biogenesis protein CcdA
MLVAGLFSAFSPCTMAVTPSQSEPVLHWQLFVDLLAAVVVVVVTRAAGRLRE